MLDAAFAACVFDENPPHGLGGRTKKMSTAVPFRRSFLARQPQIGLMHQTGRLQVLTGGVVGQFAGREPRSSS